MTDQVPAPFQPSPAPAANTVERPKKERKKREVKPKLDKIERASIKKTHKKKTKKTVTAKPAGMVITIPIKEYAELMVAPGAKVFLKIYKLLAGEPKLLRGKVLAELTKVLA